MSRVGIDFRVRIEDEFLGDRGERVALAPDVRALRNASLSERPELLKPFNSASTSSSMGGSPIGRMAE